MSFLQRLCIIIERTYRNVYLKKHCISPSIFLMQTFLFIFIITKNNVFSQELVSYFKFTPGDALEVKIYPDTASFPNGIYHIDDNGYVDFPIIGMTKVSERTPDDVENILKEVYISYLARPNIHVRPLVRVSLIGGFYRPGLYWVDSRVGMWNVIQLAGGTTRDDGLKKLKWERNGQILTSNLIPYVESGKSLHSIGFKTGDQIYVTSKQKKEFWDVFTGDILPLVTFSLTTIVSVTTAFLSVKALTEK